MMKVRKGYLVRKASWTSYNDIKCVYSIWVCMNMTENSLEHIHLVKESIVEGKT